MAEVVATETLAARSVIETPALKVALPLILQSLIDELERREITSELFDVTILIKPVEA